MGIVLFSACYYDKKDLVYPQVIASTCDTANITYALTVTNILNTSCNNCHGAATANLSGGGIFLHTYAALKPYVTNGKLINSILQNGQASAMPKNMAKLDQCAINKIAMWVNKGALNN
jgi:mono/diheme cytochrome c family protein